MKHIILSALLVAWAAAGPLGLGGQTVPMTHDHAGMADLPATDGPGYKAADVRFYQGMIAHHAQAIAMSKWAPTHGAGELLLRLAQKIDISQTDEIVMMR